MADGGVIYVFEKSEDKEYYKRVKSFKIENNAGTFYVVVYVVEVL